LDVDEKLKMKTRLQAVAIVTVMGLVIAVVVAASHSGLLGIPITGDWSHQELIDHRHRRGVKFTAYPTSRGAAHGPAMHIISSRVTNPDERAAILKEGAGNIAEYQVGVVYCQKKKTAEEARDEAGIGGRRGLAWGRFVFAGDPDFIDQFRRAL
jgi:hypothetical protein